MPTPLVEIKNENLSLRAYRQLRSGLLDGLFVPGERLVIAELAQRFGTSITPVREAIFRLASEQALDVKAATSVHVPRVSAAQLREITTMRFLLEGEAVERAAAIITREALEELTDIQARFTKAAACDPEETSIRNREFHFGFMHAADMPILTAIVENLWVKSGPHARLFHNRIPMRDLASRHHAHFDVLDALRRRNGKDARRAIEADIRWGAIMIDWVEEAEAEEATRSA